LFQPVSTVRGADMQSDLDLLAAKVAELLDRPRKRKDRRRAIQSRLNPDEWRLVNAACLERGVCLADLIRLGLSAVVGSEFPINRNTPPELQRFVARHSPTRYADEKTSVPARDAAIKRDLDQRIKQHAAIVDAGGALAARTLNRRELMTDAPAPLLSR
jgi:hypothetical protein